MASTNAKPTEPAAPPIIGQLPKRPRGTPLNARRSLSHLARFNKYREIKNTAGQPTTTMTSARANPTEPAAPSIIGQLPKCPRGTSTNARRDLFYLAQRNILQNIKNTAEQPTETSTSAKIKYTEPASPSIIGQSPKRPRGTSTNTRRNLFHSAQRNILRDIKNTAGQSTTTMTSARANLTEPAAPSITGQLPKHPRGTSTNARRNLFHSDQRNILRNIQNTAGQPTGTVTSAKTKYTEPTAPLINTQLPKCPRGKPSKVIRSLSVGEKREGSWESTLPPTQTNIAAPALLTPLRPERHSPWIHTTFPLREPKLKEAERQQNMQGWSYHNNTRQKYDNYLQQSKATIQALLSLRIPHLWYEVIKW